MQEITNLDRYGYKERGRPCSRWLTPNPVCSVGYLTGYESGPVRGAVRPISLLSPATATSPRNSVFQVLGEVPVVRMA